MLEKISQYSELWQEKVLEKKKTPKLDGYIYVPSINLYVAKEKTLHNKNWNQTYEELAKQNLQMLTIPQFIEFIKYLKNNPTNENTEIYKEIIEVKDGLLAEYLDAYFEQRNDGMYVLTQNKTHAEKLEECLMQDRAPPGINFDYWLNNPTKQGLSRKNIPDGNLHYWHPRDGSIAGFFADSDGTGLYCVMFPGFSDSSLGVHPTRKKSKIKI